MEYLMLIRNFFKYLSADQYRFLVRNLLRKRYPKKAPPLPPEELLDSLQAFYDQMSSAQRDTLKKLAEGYLAYDREHR